MATKPKELMPHAKYLASGSALSFPEWLDAGEPDYEASIPIVEANRARLQALLGTLPSVDAALTITGQNKATTWAELEARAAGKVVEP